MENIRAIIADDEKFAREAVRTFLKKHKHIDLIAECANGIDTVNAVNSLTPDLLFLDIQMPGLNGFEVIKELDDSTRPIIVFTTAYDKFALKAFEVSVIDYLLKPFDQDRFDQSLIKACSYLEGVRHMNSDQGIEKLLEVYTPEKPKNELISRLLVREARKLLLVDVTDILWFEASGDYVIIHLNKKKHLLNDSLNKLETKLNPSLFVRIHRSAIVNVNYIQEFYPHTNGEYFITLGNGTRLKLSRTYKKSAKPVLGL
jgi:two-component system, LytTR family, response regulator